MWFCTQTSKCQIWIQRLQHSIKSLPALREDSLTCNSSVWLKRIKGKWKLFLSFSNLPAVQTAKTICIESKKKNITRRETEAPIGRNIAWVVSMLWSAKKRNKEKNLTQWRQIVCFVLCKWVNCYSSIEDGMVLTGIDDRYQRLKG